MKFPQGRASINQNAYQIPNGKTKDTLPCTDQHMENEYVSSQTECVDRLEWGAGGILFCLLAS